MKNKKIKYPLHAYNSPEWLHLRRGDMILDSYRGRRDVGIVIRVGRMIDNQSARTISVFWINSNGYIDIIPDKLRRVILSKNYCWTIFPLSESNVKRSDNS